MNLRKRGIWNAILAAGSMAMALVSVALFSSPALAGLPPRFAALALHPTDPNVMLIVHAEDFGGLIYTHDGGQTWQLRCGQSVPIGGGANTFRVDTPQELRRHIIITAAGETLAPGYQFPTIGPGGCGAVLNESISEIRALAPHPTDPGIAYGWTTGYSGHIGLLRRNADGTFSPLGSPEWVEPEVSELTVASRPGGGLRFYAGAGGNATYDPVLRYSDDDGANWQDIVVPGMDFTALPRVAYVDTSDPNRIAVVLDRPGFDSLLLSDDGGQTFSEVLAGELAWITDVVATPDGAIWIGDAGEESMAQGRGLWRMASWVEQPCKVGDLRVLALAYREPDEKLLALTTYEIGSIDLTTGAFTKMSAITEVESFVECPGEDIVGACESSYCGEGWCTGGHFAISPVCDAYPACAAAGRMYDEGKDYFTGEWCNEAPNPLACTTFKAGACIPFGSGVDQDAGSGGSNADAGPIATGDGGTVGWTDAGTGGTGGSGAGIGPTNGTSGTGSTTSGAGSPPATIDDGCECSASTTGRAGLGGGVWSLLGIGALLWRQRRQCFA